MVAKYNIKITMVAIGIGGVPITGTCQTGWSSILACLKMSGYKAPASDYVNGVAMWDILRNKLNVIFSDFRAEVENSECLCDLKTLRFDTNEFPEYRNRMVQQLYLLRYMCAYVAEYTDVFGLLLRDRFLETPLVATSLGCGAALDYYGLHFAASQSRGYMDNSITYKGIDLINWGYKERIQPDNCSYEYVDVTDCEIDENTNIITLPKSIGEFSPTTLETLRRRLSGLRYQRNKIAVVSSLRKTRSEMDRSRTTDIVNAISQSGGYRILEGGDGALEWRDPGWIGHTITGFSYPDEIKDFVVDLPAKCPAHRNRGTSCDQNCGAMSRNPMFQTEHAVFQITKLERG